MTRAPRHRGLSFLEVVLATAMLAAMAASVLGSISFLQSVIGREKHRLAGTEVAHRVITQYLEDPDLLPDEKLPIQQGDTLYRVAFREEVLTDEAGEEGQPRRKVGRNRDELSPEQQLTGLLRRVTVSVFLFEPRTLAEAAEPVAELSRTYSYLEGRQNSVMQRLLKLVEEVQIEKQKAAREQLRNTSGKSGER